MGVSPLHASSVGLIRNPKTGRLSPQFHMVFDDWFETINCPTEYDPKAWHDKWEDLIHLKTSRIDYFNSDATYIPVLGPEWKSQEELKQEHTKLHKKNIEMTYKPSEVKPKKVEKTRVSKSEGASKPSENEEEQPEDGNVPLDIPPVEEVEFDKEQDMEPFLPPTSPTLRRSSRQRQQTNFFKFDKEHGYKEVGNYLRQMSKKLSRCTGNSYRDNYIANLVMDPTFGLINYLGATTLIRNPCLFLRLGQPGIQISPKLGKQ